MSPTWFEPGQRLPLTCFLLGQRQTFHPQRFHKACLVVHVYCSVSRVCPLLGRVCSLLAWSCVLAAWSRVLAVGSVVHARSLLARSVVRACCWGMHTHCWLGPVGCACALLPMPICPFVLMCGNAACCVTEELCDVSRAGLGTERHSKVLGKVTSETFRGV